MKHCKECNLPVWSHGYCKYHQNLRTDDKYKGSSIKPISEKTAQTKKELHEKDKIFYEEIWHERTHRCQRCNKPLGDTLNWSWMHHILEKGRRTYKHLRHEKHNILLVCQGCHDCFHYANLPEDCKKIIVETYKHFQSKELLP